MNLAAFYLNLDQFEKAETVLNNIYKTTDEPGLKVHAQNLLDTIKQMKDFNAQIEAQRKGGGGRPPKFIVIDGDKEPTSEELAKMKTDYEREAIVDALRVPKENEVRIAGFLQKIDCPNGSVSYTVKKADGLIIKLTSKNFQGLHLMAYVPTFDAAFGCQSVKKDIYAMLTYIPGANPKSKSAGELVAIEIVPEGFKL